MRKWVFSSVWILFYDFSLKSLYSRLCTLCTFAIVKIVLTKQENSPFWTTDEEKTVHKIKKNSKNFQTKVYGSYIAKIVAMEKKTYYSVEIVQSKFFINPPEKKVWRKKMDFRKGVASFGIHWMVLGFLCFHRKIIAAFNLSTTIVTAAQFYAMKDNRVVCFFCPWIVSCNCWNRTVVECWMSNKILWPTAFHL